MKKFLTCAVALLIVLAAVFIITSNKNDQPIIPVAEQHLNPDAYPLYSDLSWGSEQAKTFEGKFSGYEVTSIPVTDITDLSVVSTPFDNYYKNKLEAIGWTVDNSLAAGGPGASITAYKKGSDYIIVSFSTKFKGGGTNEPVQCPCDITMSVFSGAL
jgi:hypothetical protein